MKRSQFEHTVRAAGSILGDDRVLVIGSQAILASIDFVLPEAERSIETDIAALVDPDGKKADLIDGSIGEASLFQETFGYYAQGVTSKTAVLPAGWRKRLVAYKRPGTNGVTAMCLEPHDLWIAKAIAGRPKDWQFCGALLAREVVTPAKLRVRLRAVRRLDARIRDAIVSRL